MVQTSSPSSTSIYLTRPQAEVFCSDKRFRVLVAGRRFGKTFLSIAELLRAANKPETLTWYLSPSYRQSKRICWKDLKRLVPRSLIKNKHETDLSIELINGSVIALRGADNYDSLRGIGLDFLVMDEFADISQDAWTEVLRPSLADKQGKALFIGTPKGYNWAYDLWSGARDYPDWWSWQFTTLQGGNVSAEEIESSKSAMDDRTFRQEFEASFEALSSRVYDNFDRKLNCREDLEDTGAELLVGIDFNINPMSATIAVAAGDECHVLDFLEIMTSNTEEMAAELDRRYPGRSIACYPDPSGKARKTSAVAGETDFTILKRYGFEVLAPSRAPLVPDRVNAVQAMLCDATGRRRLLIHPRAKKLIKCLEGQTYKEGTSIPDKNGGLDHGNDSLGYLCWSRFNLLKQRSKPAATSAARSEYV